MRPPLFRAVLAAFACVCFTLPLVGQTEPATRTLYLVRHGAYDGKAGVDDRVENALNALGREQAALAAERLANFPIKFTSVTSSEFTRARETGDIIAARLGQECRREAHLNETLPSGRGIAPAQVYPNADAQLDAAWEFFSRPNDAATGPTHELLVCHGNVIRWFVCRALGVEAQQWTQMEIANASVTMIQIRPDGSMRLQIFNEIAHVPVEKQTWSGRGPAWPLPANKR